MTDENTLNEAAEELQSIIPDAKVVDGDKIIIFTYPETLSSNVVQVLADYDLSVSPTGMIEYTHKELTVMGGNDPMKATFIAK